MPQFTLDCAPAGGAFDVFGLSFATELGYTNMLNALDLAGIPLHAADAASTTRSCCAGGHAAFNPEPVADFLDAAVLGDGEEIALSDLRGDPGVEVRGSPGRTGRAAAAAGRRRRGLCAEVLRRRLPARRPDPSVVPQPDRVPAGWSSTP